MQYRTLRRVVWSFAVVIVAVGSLTLLGCSSDDTELRNVNNVTIPLNATTAGNGGTAIVNGQTFPGVSGAVLAQNAVPAVPPGQLANQTAALGFSGVSGSTGNFTLTTPNVVAAGNVVFASCRFTVTSSTNAAVLPVNTVITIANCSVIVSATAVPVGDATGITGTMTLNLNGTTSTAVNTTVSILDDGTLVITTPLGTTVVTVIIISATGTSGG